MYACFIYLYMCIICKYLCVCTNIYGFVRVYLYPFFIQGVAEANIQLFFCNKTG